MSYTKFAVEFFRDLHVFRKSFYQDGIGLCILRFSCWLRCSQAKQIFSKSSLYL